MTREQAIRVLNQLPNMSEQHGMHPQEMSRLIEIRLRVASAGTITDEEAEWLQQLADRQQRRVTGYDEA